MARARVTKEQWVRAALRAIVRGGVSAVAVDPLASELKISRGSFYWHFTDRDELVRTALGRWEQAGTYDVIDALADIAEPAHRLVALMDVAVADVDEELVGFEVALSADARHPAVAPVLARVTERRITYLTELYVEAGLDVVTARSRAVTVYALYIGWITLRRSCGELVPEVRRGALGPTGATAISDAVRSLLPAPRG